MIQRSVLLTAFFAGLAANHAAALVFDDGKPLPGADVKAWFTTVTIPPRPAMTWQRTVVMKPRDSTVAVFDVGDGPGETDLLLAGGIRQDGATCSMCKEGAGRMSVRGQAALSGVITVTAWHANHFPLYQTAVTDRTAGGQRSPKRDMLGDMIDALRAKGIRVYRKAGNPP